MLAIGVPQAQNNYSACTAVFLVLSFGLFAAYFWARHIHDRFVDAVAVTPTSNATNFSDPDREVDWDALICTPHNLGSPLMPGPRLTWPLAACFRGLFLLKLVLIEGEDAGTPEYITLSFEYSKN